MTRARESIIDLEYTPYYHCISRCVRRAFLCGEDKFSGQNYEHRRKWVVERISFLSSVFAIDVMAYAVMSNHYHLVLRVDKAKAERWSDRQVVSVASKLCKIPEIVKDHLKDADSPLYWVVEDFVATWRQRLMDISWFMRYLNEYLARKANAEDKCKGRFWEGRFKSQPLLDEAAVLTAMSYVDLNPIRANMAKTPEKSNYTSIQQRIQKLRGKAVDNNVPLVSFTSSSQQTHYNTFTFSLEDYLKLVDWAGRAILKNKRGYIPANEPPILERLNINSEGFVDLMQKEDDLSQLSVMGSTSALSHYIDRLEKKFVKGLRLNQKLFT
jgi:hypothetical protein